MFPLLPYILSGGFLTELIFLGQNSLHVNQLLLSAVARAAEVSVCLGCHNKSPWTRWLNQKKFTSQSLKAGTSQTKVPADWVPGENFLPGLQMAALLCFHMVEREPVSFQASPLIRTLILLGQGSTLMISPT